MSAFPEPGDTFGRYEITGVLGHGGMGVVFAATQRELGRQVALKVLAPQLAADERFRNRFTREATSLALVDSPHIVHIYEHGEHDGCLFIATQLVGGGDLRQLLEKEHGLAPTEALRIVADVASALVDAHGAGVIHRDIKPANVLLRRSVEGETFAYLCDFGIATTDRDETTLSGGVPGTVGYLAPERQQGASATVASDVYSLGCLLWATFTGHPPYQGSDVEVAMAHLRAPIPTLPWDDPVSERVDVILRRAMAKRPDERYSSAAALRREVEAAHALAVAASPAGVRTADARRRPSYGTALLSVALVGALLTVAALLMRDPGRELEPLACWDGERVLNAGLCSVPQGEEGLRWVFPSFEPTSEQCTRAEDPVDAERLLVWFCQFGEGEDGIRYSEWRSVEDAKRETQAGFGQFLPTQVELDDGSTVWMWHRLSLDRRNHMSSAVVYEHWPFSVVVQSTTRAGVEEGCEWIELRSPLSFEVTKVDCDVPE